MTTLTDWYDPKVDGQPVRVGWYQREYRVEWGRQPFMDYWDGRHWRTAEMGRPFMNQAIPWRGLTEPNEEKQ